MNRSTVFTDYLSLIGVPHTVCYSSRRFKAYPPKLGVAAACDLLTEYNVPYKRVKSDDIGDLASLHTPFFAQLTDRAVIVTDFGDYVTFRDRTGKPVKVTRDKFASLWGGKAIEATPGQESAETDLKKHRREGMAIVAERWTLAFLLLFLAVYFFITNNLADSPARIISLILYGAGIYISYLLILKQSNVHSGAADSVCGVIQREGCGTVLNTAGSSFLGLFHWSEIGLTYFSVSFGALLLFPYSASLLAGLNVLCLPYSFWSVGYQKFKAKAWCTLCLTVQLLLWLIFINDLIGKSFADLFPLGWPLAVLLSVYGIALIMIHKVVPAYFKYEKMEAAGEIDPD